MVVLEDLKKRWKEKIYFINCLLELLTEVKGVLQIHSNRDETRYR